MQTWNWRTWARGMVGAAINSAANGVLVMGFDPKTFNFFDGGALNLLSFMAASGFVGALLWMKKHPLPEDDL